MVPNLNEKLILAIDQGTSNSRVAVFSTLDWRQVYIKKTEFESIYKSLASVEQDPIQILTSVKLLLNDVYAYLISNAYNLEQISSLGIANQRETVVCWDKNTGQPLYNAILWKDTRTQDIVEDLIQKLPKGRDSLLELSGLPLSTYFSGSKIKWLLDNVPAVQAANEENRLAVGTVDTWLIWNLTGKVNYVTDVTNASRTMLMNIKTLEWDEELCSNFGINKTILAKICSSAENFGTLDYDQCPFKNVPITGCLGDQQAALIGQHCFKKGMAKTTFGTGSFMLYNVGENVVYSNQGLVSTVAYQFGKDAKPIYALEGSIGSAGDAVEMLVSIGTIKDVNELEECAKSEKDNGGVYFVPAFNGLLAPYWRPNAKSLLQGLVKNSSPGHICRAVIEAISFQNYHLSNVMQDDSSHTLQEMKVDGGMTNNELLMQTQADYLGIDVVKPEYVETTALGAAIAAAFTQGLWKLDLDELPSNHQVFRPQLNKDVKDARFSSWKELIDKC